MAVSFAEQNEEFTLPEIESKPLTSAKANHKATAKNKSKSGSAKVFVPRGRKFSYEEKEKLKELERGFILDGVALSRMTNEETGRTNPSINIGVPQYKAKEDHYCTSYFKMKALPKNIPTDSMIGGIEDRFFKSTEATKYLSEREEKGSNYTRRIYGGHTTVPTDPSKDGYNGPEGYRRNTFDLRRRSSVFDYEDPFDNPKPVNKRIRTQSAPATIQLMRQKSATAYRSYPAGGRRFMSAGAVPRSRTVQSAMPRPLETVQELATGPV